MCDNARFRSLRQDPYPLPCTLFLIYEALKQLRVTSRKAAPERPLNELDAGGARPSDLGPSAAGSDRPSDRTLAVFEMEEQEVPMPQRLSARRVLLNLLRKVRRTPMAEALAAGLGVPSGPDRDSAVSGPSSSVRWGRRGSADMPTSPGGQPGIRKQQRSGTILWRGSASARSNPRRPAGKHSATYSPPAPVRLLGASSQCTT